MPNSTIKSRRKRGGAPAAVDFILGLPAPPDSSTNPPDILVEESIMEVGTDAEVASNSDNESANTNLCLSEQLPLTANPGNSDAEASSPAMEPLRAGSASSVELVTVTPNSVDSPANFEKIMVDPHASPTELVVVDSIAVVVQAIPVAAPIYAESGS